MTDFTTRFRRLETPLYSVAEIRQMEALLFVHQDSFDVMRQASQCVADTILADFPEPIPGQTVHVLLGSGNNAGDGLLAGVSLQEKGFRVMAYRLIDKPFTGDAQKAYQAALAAGLDIVTQTEDIAANGNDIVIDAILGIGLAGPLQGNLKIIVDKLNRLVDRQENITVYAVDVPTGVMADTGQCPGSAVVADKTITFIGDKIGLHSGQGKGYAGLVSCHNLGANRLQCETKPTIFRYRCETYRWDAQRNTHKGDYGHALTIGGGKGMFGAAALSAVSALKVGTGKSSIYSDATYATQFHLENTALYEVMRCQALSDLSAYSAIIFGVGLGRDAWGQEVFSQLEASMADTQPLLIDADGLWHLAAKRFAKPISVITPHEAEAARLLDCEIKTIRENKPQAVHTLAKTFDCLAVLKGAGTLISDGRRQGFTALDACLYGVYQHGLAADKYYEKHRKKSLRASDLWDYF